MTDTTSDAAFNERMRTPVFALANGHDVTTSRDEPDAFVCLTCGAEGYTDGYLTDLEGARQWHASL